MLSRQNFSCACVLSAFFFNAPATTEIYTLSLHDALPILLEIVWHDSDHDYQPPASRTSCGRWRPSRRCSAAAGRTVRDRKSTRLNSSHVSISYAVFCLKKKNTSLDISAILQYAD